MAAAQDARGGRRERRRQLSAHLGLRDSWESYSPAPIIRMGIVGTEEPLSGSTVIAKALASTPVGSGGLITVALPCASGLKIPAGIGAPLIGISHSSYTFCAGNAWKLLARKIRLDRSRT